MDLLSIVVLTIAISLLLNLIFKRFHLSTIIGYIFTGVIISFFLESSSAQKEILIHISEFGIVFLMFTIGLEFSISHLKKMKKEVFVFGTTQVVTTAMFFGFIAHHIFQIDVKTSIIIGSALSLSSTAIVLKSLNENGDIHRPYGRNSLGILIFQDLAVIPMLLMITIFTSKDASILDLTINTIISGLIVFIILYIFGKYILQHLLSFVINSKSEELFIASIILIVLASSLLAYKFGFSHSLGAFIAGMMIAETKYKHQIEADLVPFRDILLGIFFITIGFQVNIHFILENFVTIVALTATILLLKAILIFILIRFFAPAKRAFKTALALAQVGEFSFAIFSLAGQNNLLDNNIHQILLSVVIFSLIFTSFAIRYVRSFTNIFFTKDKDDLLIPIKTELPKNHIVVCGYSKLGQKIAIKLSKRGIAYAIIEHDLDHVKEGIERNHPIFFGNAASKNVLNVVNIKEAKAVIIAIDNDSKATLIAKAIKDINKDINIAIKISHKAQIEDFKDLGIKDFVNENEVIANKLIDKILLCKI